MRHTNHPIKHMPHPSLDSMCSARGSGGRAEGVRVCIYVVAMVVGDEGGGDLISARERQAAGWEDRDATALNRTMGRHGTRKSAQADMILMSGYDNGPRI